jgi:hypothetical protein
MTDPTPQSSEPGTDRLVQTAEGIRFEHIEQPAPTGQAYVEPARAKTRREQELEAGRLRVAQVAKEQALRPPRIKSEKELMAEGHNVPVFRPNMLQADRVISHNGAPVSQQLGALMRRVGSKVSAPEATVAPGPGTGG